MFKCLSLPCGQTGMGTTVFSTGIGRTAFLASAKINNKKYLIAFGRLSNVSFMLSAKIHFLNISLENFPQKPIVTGRLENPESERGLHLKKVPGDLPPLSR